MGNGAFRRYTELIRVIAGPEILDKLPEPPLDPGRTSFFSRLMKAESLPFDEPVSGESHSPRTSGLFASESLPLDPPKPRTDRPSFVTRLFSRESLPVDAIPGPGPAGRPKRH